MAKVELLIPQATIPALTWQDLAPAIIIREGPHAIRRFLEFFVATIRNRHTREAYMRAADQFLSWCEERRLDLQGIEPLAVAAYIEQHPGSPQTIHQHLTAIRRLFDWLVEGKILQENPAEPVRGPRYSIKKGKTPVLTKDEARKLLDGIDTSHVVGLRDRALIGVMIYSFARVSAVAGMKVEDYYQQGRRSWLRLHEKRGKYHEVPVHHKAEEYLDDYIEAAGIAGDKKGPLFRTTRGRSRILTEKKTHRTEVYLMIKRRAREVGVSEEIGCHTFRATGITAYLENGGTIDKAQAIAAHESPRTTKLYDRTSDVISLDEIERILL
jgi:site-specific recombinase XerD